MIKQRSQQLDILELWNKVMDVGHKELRNQVVHSFNPGDGQIKEKEGRKTEHGDSEVKIKI